MKKLAAIILVALAVAASAWAQPLRSSEIRKDCVQSSILGETVEFNVYLPVGYDASAQTQYPVVYLLHGLSDDYDAWVTRGHMKEVADLLIASGEIRKMVIIMPDAGDADTHNQWNGYFNMPGRPYEDFFFGEFLPEVERRYHAVGDKSHRAIMGLSMGGGGSTVYCQRHPDMFSSCYAMSAWLDNETPWASDPSDKLYIVCKAVHEHSAIAFVQNADEAAVEALRSVKWFFDCGDDDFLLDLSLKLYQEMRGRGIKSELRIRDGWHCWEYWHQALRMALPFASRNFAL